MEHYAGLDVSMEETHMWITMTRRIAGLSASSW
jgi:hypothetical protein